MELTSKNVQDIFFDSLFRDEELKTDIIKLAVYAKGLTINVGFHPERLEKHREEVKDLLSQLPEPFRQSKGGGWSFLMACENSKGEQWGEHRNIEQLVLLGLALKMVDYLVPRELWGFFPGNLPYFVIECL